jgi:hypothetical protein
VVTLSATDYVIVRREGWRARPRSGARRSWVLVGVVANKALAQEIATLVRRDQPDRAVRACSRASFYRELPVAGRERILDALRNPTLADKERFRVLRAEAEARQGSAPVEVAKLP